MNKNFDILFSYIKIENYYIDKRILKQRLYSDPNEGILPITNTLDFFNVKNIVATVPKTSLNQLPNYFICQVKKGNQYGLVLVDKTKVNRILTTSDRNQSTILSKEEFLLHWTGLIIVIEKNEKSKKIKNVSSFYLKTGIYISLALLITYIGFSTQSLQKIIYMVVSLVGLLLSYLIIKEKLNHDEPSRFCTISKSTDCNSVLNSKESKLFKFIDLSDTSIIYFSFTILSFIFDSNSIIYFILSILSLPIVGYSIYSQKYKIKKWCPLCLGIGFILILQFTVLVTIYKNLDFSYLSLILLFSVLTALITAWNELKEILIIKKQNNSLVIENMTFRRNYKLFLPYYNSIKKIDTNENLITDICLGNKKAPISFLIITNPLCEICFKVHSVFINLLQKYQDKIQVKFRFFVPFHDKKNPGTIIAERFLDLYLNEYKVFNEAFTSWYSKVKIQKWIDTWGECKNENINLLLKEQQDWCFKNNINYTPAILIDGKIFPKFYNAEDIINFVEFLINQKEKT